MKTKRIELEKTYMAVSHGKEIKIKVDIVLLDVVHGTNVETGRGIALPSSYFVAGPLKEIIGPKSQD